MFFFPYQESYKQLNQSELQVIQTPLFQPQTPSKMSQGNKGLINHTSTSYWGLLLEYFV